MLLHVRRGYHSRLTSPSTSREGSLGSEASCKCRQSPGPY
jgi:hypothetical protein